jgi:hypothetical protein
MTTEPLTCPYCNALVPLADAAAAGRRVPCPRCGEAFTLNGPPPGPSPDIRQASPRDEAGGSLTAAPNLDVDRRLRAGRSNRIVAACVLGVMGLMAAVGLAYALYTVGDRRAHDTAMPPPPRRSPLAELVAPNPPAPAVTPAAAARPADLEAVRWLPKDTTVIAGVQVAEMRQSEAGRNLMNHLFHIGKIQIDADLLARWTGLKLEEIDHVVVGIKTDDPVPPRTVVVVQTVRPYDAAAVKEALAAEPIADAAGKALFRGKPRDGGLRPFLWFADERTLVVGLMEKHLEAVPDRPGADLERLSPEVRTLLEERLESGGPAWVVGYSADWRRTAAGLLLGPAPEKGADLAGHIRGLAAQLEAGIRMTAAVQCDDADAAKALEAKLIAARGPGHDGGMKTALEGQWLTVQFWGDPAKLFEDITK